MVRAEGPSSNQLFETLEAWNDFLQKSTRRFKGPTP